MQQLEKYQTFFEASPTIRLLKSDHAPFVLDFLNQTFKSSGELSLGQEALRSRLIVYVEELHEVLPDALSGGIDTYLRSWSDAGWLKRFLDASSNEPQYQLTQYSEDTIQFVDLALSRRTGLVGTESRLRLVIDTLADLVRGASSDPKRRLAYLQQQQDSIQREMDALNSGRPVEVYKPVQIRERFQMAVGLLKTLQGDFRAVEERFHTIARDVQIKQQQAAGSRGEILGTALDSEDLLKTQDEGISFYAFVAFLFSPDGQRGLRETIEEVTRLESIQDQRDAIEHLRNMVPALLRESDKVLKTTGRLSSTLRKLLDPKTIEDHRRLTDMLRDIKQLAAQLREAPPTHDIVEIQTTSGISSPMSRTFWKQPQVFDAPGPAEHVVDLDRARQVGAELAAMQRLDFEKLRGQITRLLDELNDLDELTLEQVVERFPPRSGVLELIGYLQIAHDDGCDIIQDASKEITLVDEKTQVKTKVRLPHVVFKRSFASNSQSLSTSKPK